MKKLIIGCAALASALALNAAVESANTFGILKVESDQEQVIISVPWVSVGTSEDAISPTISPTDLVCPTGLQAGDYMMYYNASGDKKYYCWKIIEDSAGTPSWTPYRVLPDTTTESYLAGSTEVARRGRDAIILVRSAQTITETHGAIYLNGQYKSEKASVPMSPGSAGNPVMTFFAPTTAAPVNLNDFTYTTENHPVAGDIIRYGADKQFFYDGSWCYYKRVSVTIDDEVEWVTKKMTDSTLPAGVAAIYISVGGNPTFSL